MISPNSPRFPYPLASGFTHTGALRDRRDRSSVAIGAEGVGGREVSHGFRVSLLLHSLMCFDLCVSRHAVAFRAEKESPLCDSISFDLASWLGVLK